MLTVKIYRAGSLLALWLCLAAAVLQAQVTMQVILRAPYPAYLDQLVHQTTITITNTSVEPVTLYLRARIANGEQYIQTRADRYSDPIALAGHATLTLNTVSFNFDSFLGSGVLDDNLTNTAGSQDKILPEGQYSFCIYAYTRDGADYYPFALNGDPDGGPVCSYFPILFAQPPVITSPIEDARVNFQVSHTVSFAWTRPTRTIPGSTMKYDLYIVKMAEGDDPNVDMQNAFQYHSNYYVKIPDIPINNFVFNTDINAFQLEDGQRYAVMVQAKDAGADTRTFLENEGKSEVVTFVAGAATSPAAALTLLYPYVSDQAYLDKLVQEGNGAVNAVSGNPFDLAVSDTNAMVFAWQWEDTAQAPQNVTAYRFTLTNAGKPSAGETAVHYTAQIPGGKNALNQSTLIPAALPPVINPIRQYTGLLERTLDQCDSIGLQDGALYTFAVTALDDNGKELGTINGRDFRYRRRPLSLAGTIRLHGRLLYHFDDAAGVNYPIPNTSIKIYRRDIAENLEDSAYITTDANGAFTLPFDRPSVAHPAQDSAEYRLQIISPYYQQPAKSFVIADTTAVFNLGDLATTVFNYGLTLTLHERFPNFYLGNDSVVTYSTGRLAQVDTTRENPMPGLRVVLYRKSRPAGIPQHEGQDQPVAGADGLPASYIPVAEGITTYRSVNGHPQTYVHFDHLVCNLQKGDEYYVRVVEDESFRKLYLARGDTAYDLVAPQMLVAFDPAASGAAYAKGPAGRKDAPGYFAANQRPVPGTGLRQMAWFRVDPAAFLAAAGDTMPPYNGQTHFETSRDYYFLSTKPPTSVITGQLVYRWPDQKTIRPLANADFEVRVEYLKNGQWTGVTTYYGMREHTLERYQNPVTINGEAMNDNGFTVAHGHTDASGHFRIEVANFNYKGNIVAHETTGGQTPLPTHPPQERPGQFQQVHNEGQQQVISPATGGFQNGAGNSFEQISFQGSFRGQYDLQNVFGGAGARGAMTQQGFGAKPQKNRSELYALDDRNGPGPNENGTLAATGRTPGENPDTLIRPSVNGGALSSPYAGQSNEVTYTRIFRIHLSYPYDEFYLSPDNDIVVQALDSVNAGVLTAVVADQDISITAKDAHTNARIGGMKVLLFRDPDTAPLFTDNRPIGEGQELDVLKGLYRPAFDKHAVDFDQVIEESNGNSLSLNMQKPFYWVSDTTSNSNGLSYFKHLYGLYPGYYVQVSSNPVNNENYYRPQIVGGTEYWNLLNINYGSYFYLGYADENYLGGYADRGDSAVVALQPLPSRIAGRVMARPFGGSSGNQGQVGLGNVPVALFLDKGRKGAPLWQKLRQVNTDGQGYFEFLGAIPANSTHFKLEVNAPGYHLDNAPDPSDKLNPVPATSAIINQYGRQVVLNPILLVPDGLLEGKIVDEQGNPVDAYVQVGDGPMLRTQETYPVVAYGGGLVVRSTYKKIPAGTFDYPAVPGKQSLHIYPMDTRFFNDTVQVTVGTGTTHLLPITVYGRRHRIRLQVNGPDGKPVPGAKVYLLSDTPSVTDQAGQVRLAFENVSVNHYTLRVDGPAGSDYIPQEIAMKNEETKKEVFYSVQLKAGSAVSGQVLLDGQAVAHAKVYLDYQEQSPGGFQYVPVNGPFFQYNGGNIGPTAQPLPAGSLPAIEVYTGPNGHFTLHGIPLTSGVVTLHATLDTSFTVIGDAQTAGLGNQKAVTLNLHRYNGMQLQSLWGFPMELESLATESGGKVKLTARVDIGKGHTSFRFLQAADALVRVRDVEFKAVSQNGQSVGEPVAASVPVEALSALKLGYLNRYNVLLTRPGAAQNPAFSTQPLLITRSGSGQGALSGQVHIVDNSFNYPSSYLNFTNKDQFYLCDSTAGGMVHTITALEAGSAAGGPSAHRYHLCNAGGDSIRFSFIQFDAHADPEHSYIDPAGRIHLATSLQCHIPNAQPSHFTVQIPDITLDNNRVSISSGSQPLEVQLEKWRLRVSDWTVDPSKGGIYSTNALLQTGSIDVPVKFFNLRADMFVIDSFLVHDLTVGGGIEPLALAASTQANLFYDDRTGSELSGHWTLSIVNANPGQAAASLHGLTGLDPGTVQLQYVSLLSNGENIMSILQSGDGLQLYHIALFNPTTIFSGPDYFSLQGSMDLRGPRLSPFAATLVYTGKPGHLGVKVERVSMNFEGKGYMQYIAKDAAVDVGEHYFRLKHDTTINYQHPIHTASYLGGYVVEPGKINPMPVDFIADDGVTGADSFHVIAYTPYVLPLTNDNSGGSSTGYSLDLHWGHMLASASTDWGLYSFNGDLLEDGGGGTLSADGKKTNGTFTVYGAIQATTKDVQVTNVPKIPGLTLDYNFAQKKLIGTLDFSQNGLDFGPVTAKGTAEFDIDPAGWYFLAGATMNAPVIGVFQAGVLLGNYKAIDSHIKDVLTQAVGNPRSLCRLPEKTIRGAFLTGEYNILNSSAGFTVPVADVSVSYNAVLSIGASLLLDIGQKGAQADFEIRGYADINAEVDVPCTTIGGELKMAANMEAETEPGAKGQQQYKVDGNIGAEVNAHLQAGIPGPDGCNTVFDGQVTKNVQVGIQYSSGSGLHTSFSLGSGGMGPCFKE